MKYVKIMWDSGSEVEKCIDGSLSSVTSKDLNGLFAFEGVGVFGGVRRVVAG